MKILLKLVPEISGTYLKKVLLQQQGACGNIAMRAFRQLSLSTNSVSAAVQYPHVPIVHMILASCRSASLSWFHLEPPTGKLEPGPLLLQR